MAQLLVRGLESETIERLKQKAKRHYRSLQGETKLISLPLPFSALSPLKSAGAGTRLGV